VIFGIAHEMIQMGDAPMSNDVYEYVEWEPFDLDVLSNLDDEVYIGESNGLPYEVTCDWCGYLRPLNEMVTLGDQDICRECRRLSRDSDLSDPDMTEEPPF
jgi:hypothetical protein